MPKSAATKRIPSAPVEANVPVHSIRHRSLKASIWENPTKKGLMHTVTLQRSYRDEKGHWHDSGSFRLDELMNLAKLLADCHTWITHREATSRSVNRNNPTE